MLRTGIIQLTLILSSLISTAQSDSSTCLSPHIALSGELLGAAVGIGAYGEYYLERKINLSLRTGIGRTSLQFENGDAAIDKLTFPALLAISHGNAGAKVRMELATGIALDIFETRNERWSNGEWVEERSKDHYFRWVPIAVGLRYQNESGFLWRAYIATNRSADNQLFPTVGMAFGKVLR